MNDQAYLLEMYLLALRSDLDAAPPPALDPELAAFARELMRTRRAAPPGYEARLRVWNRALASSQRSPNGRPTYDEERDMVIALGKQARNRTHSYSMMAAALAVALFAGLVFASRFSPEPPDETPLMIGSSNDDDDATAVAQAATPTFTPTPIPASPVSTAAPVGMEASGAAALVLNSLVAGEITDPTQSVSYTFIAPNTGQILVSAQSRDFQPSLSHSITRFDGSGGGGGGGGGGRGGQTPAVYQIDTLMDVIAGDTVQINVSSADGRGGAFALIAREVDSSVTFAQPVPTLVVPDVIFMGMPSLDIAPGQLIEGEISAEQPMQVFRFVAPEAALYRVQLEGDRLITLAQPGMNLPGDPQGNFFINRIEAPLAVQGTGLFIEQPGVGGATMQFFTDPAVQAIPMATAVPSGGVFSFTPAQLALPNALPAQFFWTPSNGDVIVNVGSIDGTNGGVFELEVNELAPQVIQYGETVSGTLNEEQPVGYYTFEAAAGDVINLRVEGADGFDTEVRLFGAGDNFALTAVDDDGGGGYDPEIYRHQIAFAGTYHIVVAPSIVGGGAYALTLERVEPLSLDAGAQTIDLNSKHLPQIVFEGTAGETVRLSVSLPEGVDGASVLSVEVGLAQNGQALTSFSRDSGAGGAADAELISGTVTIPADGTVSVLLNGRFDLSASGGLRLQVALE